MTDVRIAGRQGPNGVTDDLAEKLYRKTVTSFMAVVEFHLEDVGERVRDGKERVSLSIGNLEVAVDDKHIAEDHLREIQRAIHMNRKLHAPDAQLTIDTRDDLEPTVEQVIANNPGLVRHDYVEPDTLVADGETPLCELCGHPEAYVLHQDASINPFELPDEDDDEEPPVDDFDDDPEGD